MPYRGITGSQGAMREEFHHRLDEASDLLVSSALRLVEQMPDLTRRFLAGDESSVAEARELGRTVSRECRDVEERGFVLLARESPVASDLRRIVAMLRLVHDVDRSSSLLSHVPEALEVFDPRELPEDCRQIVAELADRSHVVFRRGVEAWRLLQSDAVEEIDELDADVDRLQRDLLQRAAADDIPAHAQVGLGLISRYYERIADHGVALAEDASFVVTGRRGAAG